MDLFDSMRGEGGEGRGMQGEGRGMEGEGRGMQGEGNISVKADGQGRANAVSYNIVLKLLGDEQRLPAMAQILREMEEVRCE